MFSWFVGRPSCLLAFFTKENNISDFLFASLEDRALQKGSTLKEFVPGWGKFFPVRADPYLEIKH